MCVYSMLVFVGPPGTDLLGLSLFVISLSGLWMLKNDAVSIAVILARTSRV